MEEIPSFGFDKGLLNPFNCEYNAKSNPRIINKYP